MASLPAFNKWVSVNSQDFNLQLVDTAGQVRFLSIHYVQSVTTQLAVNSKVQILTFAWGCCWTLIYCLMTVCFNTLLHSSVCRMSIQFFTIPIQWTTMDMSLFIQWLLWKGECTSVLFLSKWILKVILLTTLFSSAYVNIVFYFIYNYLLCQQAVLVNSKHYLSFMSFFFLLLVLRLWSLFTISC